MIFLGVRTNFSAVIAFYFYFSYSIVIGFISVGLFSSVIVMFLVYVSGEF